MQDLNPAELAAVLSSIIAGETPPKPSTLAEYGSSEAVFRVFESMEDMRVELYDQQMAANIDAPLGIDLRLAGQYQPALFLRPSHPHISPFPLVLGFVWI